MTISKLQKRFLLFLLVCIPLRFIITVLAAYIPLKYLPFIGVFFIIFGIGFLYLNFFNKRLTGVETGGDVIWWHDLRPVHGFLSLLFGILAVSKVREAWIVLLIDTIFGLLAFLAYHTINKNIFKLF